MTRELFLHHRILVRRSHGIPGVYDNIIRDAAAAALSNTGADAACFVEITLVHEHEIRRHNNDYRGKDSVTDVLCFPAFDLPVGTSVASAASPADYIDGRVSLGEIIICLSRATEQAAEYGHSIEREAAFLAIHGILHLSGYDHENDIYMERIMIDKQKEIMSLFGLNI